MSIHPNIAQLLAAERRREALDRAEQSRLASRARQNTPSRLAIRKPKVPTAHPSLVGACQR
jgi:hypothetical protein